MARFFWILFTILASVAHGSTSTEVPSRLIVASVLDLAEYQDKYASNLNAALSAQAKSISVAISSPSSRQIYMYRFPMEAPVRPEIIELKDGESIWNYVETIKADQMIVADMTISTSRISEDVWIPSGGHFLSPEDINFGRNFAPAQMYFDLQSNLKLSMMAQVPKRAELCVSSSGDISTLEFIFRTSSFCQTLLLSTTNLDGGLIQVLATEYDSEIDSTEISRRLIDKISQAASALHMSESSALAVDLNGFYQLVLPDLRKVFEDTVDYLSENPLRALDLQLLVRATPRLNDGHVEFGSFLALLKEMLSRESGDQGWTSAAYNLRSRIDSLFGSFQEAHLVRSAGPRYDYVSASLNSSFLSLSFFIPPTYDSMALVLDSLQKLSTVRKLRDRMDQTGSFEKALFKIFDQEQLTDK